MCGTRVPRRLLGPDSAQMSGRGTFSQAPFMPHHFINETPQSTFPVGYETVCKANEEVINILFLTE